MFTALEDADNQSIQSLWDLYGDDPTQLLRGWHLVSRRLRLELQLHTDHCDCGSIEWLKRIRLRNAGLDDE